MLSPTSIPKQLIGKPLSVPVLESTGEAKHSQPSHIYWKNFSANSGLYKRLATVFATRIYASLGVSPFTKYPPVIVFL